MKKEMNSIHNVALISVYPPPFGGVSIHAKVLASELFDRNMLNVLVTGGTENIDDPHYLKRVSELKVFNKNIHWHYKIPFILRLWSKKIKVIHGHAGLNLVPFLLIHRFILKKKIIHTIHNQWVTERYCQLNLISKLITNIFLKDDNTYWICVNDNAYNQMIELGVKKENISVIPAYIPNTKNTLICENDINIIHAIKEFKKGSKLIGVYGFKFYYDSNGQDIYGFNFSIDVFKRLIKIKPSVKLVVLIPSASPHDEKDKFDLRIKNEGLTANVLTLFDNPIINMNLFWHQLDIYFRPTTDDGDSLAIREALENGVTVVASDVCSRPNQTKTFRSLNIDDALKNLNDVIDTKEIIETYDDKFLNKILQIYTDMS